MCLQVIDTRSRPAAAVPDFVPGAPASNLVAPSAVLGCRSTDAANMTRGDHYLDGDLNTVISSEVLVVFHLM